MKLYTESQIREALDNEDFAYIADIVIAQMQPIELPSDEEIEELTNNCRFEQLYIYGFIDGTKWIKKQILKQI